MARNSLQVRTALGVISGEMDQGVYSYKGIAYANSLEGFRQFAPPEPISAWGGIYDATSYGGICPQRSLLRSKVSSQSLLLNIWSPRVDRNRRPVLFFIHGGSFIHGAGSETYYHGSYLARMYDIVVVSCNYRLGVYGFLDFGLLDRRFTANNGVQDVITALQWVQDHISDFGGDPENVTLMGQSAGGTMVAALATSCFAEKLFHRAIMASGGPTQVQSHQTCRKTTEAFLHSAQITTKEELLAYDSSSLITEQKQFVRQYGLGAATFRVTVDGKVLTDFPIRAALCNQGSVPMLIGTTKEEMGFMAIRPLAKFLDVGKIVSLGLSLETAEMKNQLSEAYRAMYGEHRGEAMMYTDLLFRISSIWLAQAISRTGKAWMYRFDFETRALRMNGLHAIHSSDLPYLFGNFKSVLVRPLFLIDDMEIVQTVALELQSDLVTFMRTGNLDWPMVTDDAPLGKCYDSESCIARMVDDRIAQLYKETQYQKRSFAGSAI